MKCSQLEFCRDMSTSSDREWCVSLVSTASADARFRTPRTGWNFSVHLRDLGPQLSPQDKDLRIRIHNMWIALKLQPLLAYGSEEKQAAGMVFLFTPSCFQLPPLAKERKSRWNEMEGREDGQVSLHLSYARKTSSLWDCEREDPAGSVLLSSCPWCLSMHHICQWIWDTDMLIYPSAKDCVTVDSVYCGDWGGGSRWTLGTDFNSYDPNWFLLFFCTPSLPLELQWHVSAAFVFIMTNLCHLDFSLLLCQTVLKPSKTRQPSTSPSPIASLNTHCNFQTRLKEAESDCALKTLREH